MRGRWWDRLTFGVARRRRHIERQLRELDRWYADQGTTWSGSAPSPRRRAGNGRGIRLGRVLVASTLSMLAGAVWLSVFAPGALPAGLLVGLGLRDAPPPSSPHTYTDGSYRFVSTQPGNPAEPVGYNPCRTIKVVVNLEGAPPDGRELVQTAVEHIHGASGLDVRYDGPSSKRPGVHLSGPVLVAWADPTEVPGLKGHIVGLGGSGSIGGLGGGTQHYSSGQVTLDGPAFARMGRPDQQAVIDHEFGHVVGLAHVADRNELMYKKNVGPHSFGHGDLTGLALLGRVPCR